MFGNVMKSSSEHLIITSILDLNVQLSVGTLEVARMMRLSITSALLCVTWWFCINCGATPAQKTILRLSNKPETAINLTLSHHTGGANGTTCCSVDSSPQLHCTKPQSNILRYTGQHLGAVSLSCVSYNDTSAPLHQDSFHFYVKETNILYPFELDILSPDYGSIVSNNLCIELSKDASKYDQILLEVAGLDDTVLPSTMTTIQSHHETVMEPGSWFYSVTPMSSATGVTVRGKPSVGYIEFVLNETDITKSRKYVTRPPPPATTSPATTTPTDKPIMVCIFSGDKIDGQRSVWLQQSEYMDAAQFSFTWLLASDNSQSGTTNSIRNTIPRMRNYNKNVFVGESPDFAMSVEELNETPGDGRPPASEVWHGNSTNMFLYAHDSWEHANRSIEKMLPTWSSRMYSTMRDAVVNTGCDVVVYANDRHFCSNSLILDVTRSLRIPSVGELSNLFVHPLTVPDVIVGPSVYAAEHESILTLLSEQARNTGDEPTVRVEVISPSVNTNVLKPYTRDDVTNDVYRHPGCLVTGGRAPGDVCPCVVIGFFARLSKEKNPGLFLQAAYEILQAHPFARFTIIGDGVLRGPLEDLAARLQISWAVHFTGWASGADLPALLAGVDIVINPTSWPETFCIANIEVMSMAVPLVTFAVGGIGEYVQDPALNANHSSSFNDSSGDFSVSANAVVVHRATPEALARAALHLIRRPALRRTLGQSGRKTVLAHFGVERQMSQYSQLYWSLIRWR